MMPNSLASLCAFLAALTVFYFLRSKEGRQMIQAVLGLSLIPICGQWSAEILLNPRFDWQTKLLKLAIPVPLFMLGLWIAGMLLLAAVYARKGLSLTGKPLTQ